MGYLGYKPADKPLTAADITDSIITSAKIVDGTIANADINSSAAIAKTKLNLTGTIGISDLSATGTASSATFLRGDNTWGSAGAAAGQVIQVLSATDSTERTTTSTSFVTASNTLSVTITPSSASNKIFLIFDGYVGNTSANDSFTTATIYRGATDLGASSSKGLIIHQVGTGSDQAPNMGGMSFLDSPATTSAITYQVYIRQSSGGTVRLNWSNSKSSLTVMEIKG